MHAYEETIRNTATKESPWYVIPADNKWFTRIVVASAVITSLASLDLAYPTVSKAKLKELKLARETLMKTNGIEMPVADLQTKVATVGG